MRKIVIILLLMVVCQHYLKAQKVDTIKYDDYISLRNGIPHFVQLLKTDQPITVAYLGGSITYGPGWRDKVSNYLQLHYATNKFIFKNVGIPSLGSLPHSFRLRNDLPDLKKVNVLFVEAAVNDHANGTDSVTQLRALEGIVRQAKLVNPAIEILFLSFADPDKNASYASGKVPLEVLNHEKIASYYNQSSINLAKLVHDKIENKEFDWENDFKDLHPSPFGHELYFNVIKRFFEMAIAKKNDEQLYEIIPKPLNSENFEKGHYYSINNVHLQEGWTLENKWRPTDGLPTREGFVNIPVLWSLGKSAALKLPFTGKAIGLAVLSGEDAGVIEYSIDGSVFKKVDLFTPWSASLHLPWYLLLAADLKDGEHFLEIRVSADKNIKSKGTACRIVNFLVN